MKTDRGSIPLAHGYVRMEDPDEGQISLMCRDLGSFCVRNGYRLGSVFVDRGVPDEVLARNGFVDLLDVVRLTGAHVVVVPTWEHLSSDESIRGGLLRMVQVAGGQVLVVYQVRGGPEPDGDTPGGIAPEAGR